MTAAAAYVADNGDLLVPADGGHHAIDRVTFDDPRYQELRASAIPLSQLRGTPAEDAALAAEWEREFQATHAPRSA
jgi:hypothetical protein